MNTCPHCSRSTVYSDCPKCKNDTFCDHCDLCYIGCSKQDRVNLTLLVEAETDSDAELGEMEIQTSDGRTVTFMIELE